MRVLGIIKMSKDKGGGVAKKLLLISWTKRGEGDSFRNFFLNHHCVGNSVLGVPM
jgi:hypothetical protein